MLADLVEIGVLRQIIRVESPVGGGIADFEDILAVPETIRDWRTDSDLTVTPANIRVLYATP